MTTSRFEIHESVANYLVVDTAVEGFIYEEYVDAHGHWVICSTSSKELAQDIARTLNLLQVNGCGEYWTENIARFTGYNEKFIKPQFDYSTQT